MSRVQSPKGTYDILPFPLNSELWQTSQAWQKVEQILHSCCKCWGFQEIRLPLFENTELFHKSTGDSTDIVQKEMYTFADKGGRSMTLRPEGTPGTMRALIEAGVFQKNPFLKIFYHGPMFRYERPQQGRYRQFHQYGVEALGPRLASLDAETISLSWSMVQALGLKDCILKINTLANESSRTRYRQQLKDYFYNFRDKLSDDSLRRLETNPLRILDSKDPGDRELIQGAPKMADVLDSESKSFFEKVLELLSASSIPYEIDSNLVRGLDYYCDTVFELQLEQEQSLVTLGGGGRYANLLSSMGGPALEGIGFAFGLERLLQASIAVGELQIEEPSCDLCLIALGSLCFNYAFSLANQLRNFGYIVELWHHDEVKKLKNGLSFADKSKSRFVAILGEDELHNNQIQLKNMTTREQSLVSIEKLKNYLTKTIR